MVTVHLDFDVRIPTSQAGCPAPRVAVVANIKNLHEFAFKKVPTEDSPRHWLIIHAHRNAIVRLKPSAFQPPLTAGLLRPSQRLPRKKLREH